MKSSSLHQALRVGENLFAHAAALVIGLVLMIVGLGMGVTGVMIFIGVPLGLVGLGIFLWGGWGFGDARRRDREQG